MNLQNYIRRGPPASGIDPSDANVSEIASVADAIDAMLRRRGYEPLTEAQRDTLWSDYPEETRAMFDELEARNGLDAEALTIARDHVASLLGEVQQ